MFCSLQYIQPLEQGLTEMISVMNALISSSDKVSSHPFCLIGKTRPGEAGTSPGSHSARVWCQSQLPDFHPGGLRLPSSPPGIGMEWSQHLYVTLANAFTCLSFLSST